MINSVLFVVFNQSFPYPGEWLSTYAVSADGKRIATVKILSSVKHWFLAIENLGLVRCNHGLNDFSGRNRKNRQH